MAIGAVDLQILISRHLSLVTAASVTLTRRTGAGMTLAGAGDCFATARRRFGRARFVIAQFLGRFSSIFTTNAIVMSMFATAASTDTDAN